MDESCTLYQAIALLAYRDEDVAQRYGAKPGIGESGRDERKRDTLYPTNPNFPGTETFKGAKDEHALRALVQRWEEQDNANWSAARAQLWCVVQVDDVPAFDCNNKVEQDFWLVSTKKYHLQCSWMRAGKLTGLTLLKVNVLGCRNTPTYGSRPPTCCAHGRRRKLNRLLRRAY